MAATVHQHIQQQTVHLPPDRWCVLVVQNMRSPETVPHYEEQVALACQIARQCNASSHGSNAAVLTFAPEFHSAGMRRWVLDKDLVSRHSTHGARSSETEQQSSRIDTGLGNNILANPRSIWKMNWFSCLTAGLTTAAQTSHSPASSTWAFQAMLAWAKLCPKLSQQVMKLHFPVVHTQDNSETTFDHSLCRFHGCTAAQLGHIKVGKLDVVYQDVQQSDQEDEEDDAISEGISECSRRKIALQVQTAIFCSDICTRCCH